MKIKSFLAIALAALSLAACNKDAALVNKEAEILEGQKTYAQIDIALAEGQTKAVTPAAGDELAVLTENNITSASIYIFKYSNDNSGIAEVKKDVTATASSTGIYEMPSTAVMMTSGKKHIIVVANMSTAVKAAADAAFATGTYESFYDKLYAVIGATPAAASIAAITTTTDQDAIITMSGESDPTLVEGVSSTEAETETNPNHVVIYVDRLPAKIDVALTKDSRATFLTNMNVQESATAPVVGNLKGVAFDTRNMNLNENIMKSITGTFVNSPLSSKNDWAWTWPYNAANNDWNKFYPVVSETAAFPFKTLTAAADASTTITYRGFVSYMPENTNEDALKGNTSYVALKGSYVPAADLYVKGFDNTGMMDVTTVDPLTGATSTVSKPGLVKLLNENTAIAAGKFSLFNYEYNIAFSAQATEVLAKSDDYFKTAAAYQLASKNSLTELKDITAAEISIKDASTVTSYDEDKAYNEAGNVAAMKADAVAAGLGLHLYKTATSNADGEEELITVVGYYVWDAGTGNVINEGVDFPALTFGVYKTDDTGLVCYYRVDIYDADLLTTNMLRNSVIRNYSYHMNIASIKKIGYPTQIDLVINPDLPLSTNTFVQAHVIVNKWTAKLMDNVVLG